MNNATTSVPAKKKTGKKILIIVLAIVLVLVLLFSVFFAKSQGLFAKGNAKEYSVENTPALEQSPLQGKTLIFLGSSVTAGSASKGESFVEFLEKSDGIIPIEEAVSGTTLVTDEANSYIERMKKIDKNIKADALVCQLSTNDASRKKPLGAISNSKNLEDFDTETIAGAIEYIILYAEQTWGCPVVFFTGTNYENNLYGDMVNLLLKIQEKWDIGVIDLWNNAEMNSVGKEDYALYMNDPIHPTKAGYRDWWLPVMQQYLYAYLPV